MSTIKLELTVDANNIEVITEFLARISATTVGGKKVADMKVVDAEEVAPQKTPAKPRPSRAKAKPEPEPEDEDDDLDGDDDLDDDLEDTDEEAITADDLRAKQAEKVDKHRAAIRAQLGKLKAAGIKDLDEKHYSAYFDFLSKLK